MTHGLGEPPKRPFFRREFGELGLVTVGKLASLGSLILCNVLVARWARDAGEYGHYAAAMSLALVLDAAIGVPIDLAVIRFTDLHPRERARVDGLHGAAIRLKFSIGLLVLAAAILGGDFLSPLVLGAGSGRVLLTISLLSTVVLLLMRSVAARLQTQGQFVHYAALDVAQGALRVAAISVPLLLGRQTAEAFLTAHVAGTALALIAGLWLLPKEYLWAPWPQRADLREAAVHTAFTAGIVVCGTLSGRSDVPIVAAARSAEDAGQYAVALQVATLLTLLASYYSVVMQPRIIQFARSGQLGASLRWNALWGALLCVLTAAVALWVLPVLIPGFFGARYAAAVPVAQVLLIGTCMDLFSMPVLMVFSIQRFPLRSLVGEVAIAVGFFGSAGALASRSMLAMASLVTAVRVTKLLLYGGITLNYFRSSGRQED